jgi:hypothetical protein
MRGEAHLQYLVLFDQLLVEFPDVKAAVAAYYDAFILLLAQEKKIVDMKRSSDYTQRISDVDNRDDRLITGIKEIINASLHHFDSATVAAAQSLALRMKAFGDIPAKSYEEEVAAIDILITDLKSTEYVQKVCRLGLMPWVQQLLSSVTEFKELLRLRNIEQSEKPNETLQDIRNQIEPLYRKMIGAIDAASFIDTEGKYTEFIKRLNTQVTYFNDHNHRPARKNIKTANVEPISVQQYTGKAITPIPLVRFEGSELSFAKDFTLIYKNNVNRGVATIGIVGKGIYTGKIVVTFNIE